MSKITSSVARVMAQRESATKGDRELQTAIDNLARAKVFLRNAGYTCAEIHEATATIEKLQAIVRKDLRR